MLNEFFSQPAKKRELGKVNGLSWDQGPLLFLANFDAIFWTDYCFTFALIWENGNKILFLKYIQCFRDHHRGHSGWIEKS